MTRAAPSQTPRGTRHDRPAPAELRRRVVLRALEKPRTQAELRDMVGLSNSGILQLLRRLERDGLARPAERIGRKRVWEKERG